MRKVLLSALAAAVLVVLYTSAQGTAALWRAEGTVHPGLITTGSLALEVGDRHSSGTQFTFTDLNTSTMAPGGFVQAALTVSNAGTTELAYTLAGAGQAVGTSGAADVALAAAVELSIHAVPDAAGCTAGTGSPGTALYKGPLADGAAFAQPRTLTPTGAGSSETLCVKVALPGNAPQAASGGTLVLELSWRGDQL